ncbi:hypothetical protein T492DRAFT_901917, partial [Pavlovales sp. CCMP2436]
MQQQPSGGCEVQCDPGDSYHGFSLYRAFDHRSVPSGRAEMVRPVPPLDDAGTVFEMGDIVDAKDLEHGEGTVPYWVETVVVASSPQLLEVLHPPSGMVYSVLPSNVRLGQQWDGSIFRPRSRVPPPPEPLPPPPVLPPQLEEPALLAQPAESSLPSASLRSSSLFLNTSSADEESARIECVLLLPDRAEYVGQLATRDKARVPHGVGWQRFGESQSCGQFVDGKLYGLGVRHSATSGVQSLVSGQFQHGQPSGLGVTTMPDHGVFRGCIASGNLLGLGVAEWVPGAVGDGKLRSYAGDWQKLVTATSPGLKGPLDPSQTTLDGLGRVQREDYVYLGSLRAEWPEGFGCMTFKSGALAGSELLGQFRKSRAQGACALILPGGEMYIIGEPLEQEEFGFDSAIFIPAREGAGWRAMLLSESDVVMEHITRHFYCGEYRNFLPVGVHKRIEFGADGNMINEEVTWNHSQRAWVAAVGGEDEKLKRFMEELSNTADTAIITAGKALRCSAAAALVAASAERMAEAGSAAAHAAALSVSRCVLCSLVGQKRSGHEGWAHFRPAANVDGPHAHLLLAAIRFAINPLAVVAAQSAEEMRGTRVGEAMLNLRAGASHAASEQGGQGGQDAFSSAAEQCLPILRMMVADVLYARRDESSASINSASINSAPINSAPSAEALAALCLHVSQLLALCDSLDSVAPQATLADAVSVARTGARSPSPGAQDSRRVVAAGLEAARGVLRLPPLDSALDSARDGGVEALWEVARLTLPVLAAAGAQGGAGGYKMTSVFCFRAQVRASVHPQLAWAALDRWAEAQHASREGAEELGAQPGASGFDALAFEATRCVDFLAQPPPPLVLPLLGANGGRGTSLEHEQNGWAQGAGSKDALQQGLQQAQQQARQAQQQQAHELELAKAESLVRLGAQAVEWRRVRVQQWQRQQAALRAAQIGARWRALVAEAVDTLQAAGRSDDAQARAAEGVRALRALGQALGGLGARVAELAPLLGEHVPEALRAAFAEWLHCKQTLEYVQRAPASDSVREATRSLARARAAAEAHTAQLEALARVLDELRGAGAALCSQLAPALLDASAGVQRLNGHAADGAADVPELDALRAVAEQIAQQAEVPFGVCTQAIARVHAHPAWLAAHAPPP